MNGEAKRDDARVLRVPFPLLGYSLLVGRWLTLTSETAKGAGRASTAGSDASVEPICDSRLGHGAGLRQHCLRPRGAFVIGA